MNECPKCDGKGTVFTDHGMAGVDTTSECYACEGSGVSAMRAGYHDPKQHDYERGDKDRREPDPLCLICGQAKWRHD